MTTDELIRKNLEVKRVGPPPILCWIGSSRHRLQDGTVSRGKIANLFAELNFQLGAEIGVDRGIYAETLLQSNSGLRLVCVDSWATGRGEDHYQDAFYRLSRYNAQIMRMKSLEAAKTFEDNTLDFVYIDAQRDFNAAALDIINWGRKVKQGGIISGRGYCNLFETGIVTAIDAYCRSHYVRNLYITREMEPNYLFVKHWKTN